MRLNLGCGRRYIGGYINADFSDLGSDGNPIKVDAKFNFLEGIPYDDNSVEEIVLTEVLEHFNRWNGLKVLREIYRVLQPGGKLILTVPNSIAQMERFIQVAKAYESYNGTFEDFEKAHETVSIWKWHDDIAGATHESDGMDGDSHKQFFSPKMLQVVLTNIGFSITKINPDVISVEATK